MKNSIKLFCALSMTTLFSIVACGNKDPLAGTTPMDEEKVAAFAAELAIANYQKTYYGYNETESQEDEGVYGNVYLPSEVNGAEVVWKSSNQKIISTKWKGAQAPGMVKRPKEDTDVTLTAYVKKDGEGAMIEQTVTVKGLTYSLEDEDFEAYLFGHFCGEADQYGTTINGQRVTNGEQMFFALADVGEGLHFKDMNGSKKDNYNTLKPVLTSDVGERGVRDPFILRSPDGDTFYLIATDLSICTRGGWGMDNGGAATKTGSLSIIIWESHDLVNWTHARQIKVARDDAGMAWAPEMIYSEETGDYYIFFSSTLLDKYDNEDRSNNKNSNIIFRDCVYYTTTRDFAHFSETKTFIPNTPYQEGVSRSEGETYATNNDTRKVIDGSVMKIGNYYYSAAKDGGNSENGGGIRIQRTASLLPEYDDDGNEYIAWEFVQNLADVGFKFDNNNADNKVFEGPEWFYLNQADRKDPDVPEIGLMADYYHNTSIGYVPWATTDVEDINNENGSWRILESGNGEGQFSWDSQTKRHGTILRITADEAFRLKQAYPIAK